MTKCHYIHVVIARYLFIQYTQFLVLNWEDIVEKKPKFESGDLVKLKYGGPQMTVIAYSFGDVLCQWHKGGKMVEGSFSEASLVLSPKVKKL